MFTLNKLVVSISDIFCHAKSCYGFWPTISQNVFHWLYNWGNSYEFRTLQVNSLKCWPRILSLCWLFIKLVRRTIVKLPTLLLITFQVLWHILVKQTDGAKISTREIQLLNIREINYTRKLVRTSREIMNIGQDTYTGNT